MGKTEGLETLLGSSPGTVGYDTRKPPVYEVIRSFGSDEISQCSNLWDFVGKAQRRSSGELLVSADVENFLESIPLTGQDLIDRTDMRENLAAIASMNMDPAGKLDDEQDRLRAVLADRMTFIASTFRGMDKQTDLLKGLSDLIAANRPTATEMELAAAKISAERESAPELMVNPLLSARAACQWLELEAKGESSPLRVFLTGERYYNSKLPPALVNNRICRDLKVFLNPEILS